MEDTTPPYYSILWKKWDYTCNLGAVCQQVLTTFTYDSYGNVLAVWGYGEYKDSNNDGKDDLPGDNYKISRQYGWNNTAYIVGLPAQQKIWDSSGASDVLKSETQYIYDNNTSYGQDPTKGDLTKIRSWDSKSGNFIQTTNVYDQWGNLISTTDPLNNTSTTQIDSTYHIYTVKECNALNQCKTQAWDYRLGKITSGADANGGAMQYTYDALGRTLTVKFPDNNSTTYSYLDWGNPNAQRIRETLPDGSSDGLWTERYQDGLGRVYKSVAEGNYIKETTFSGMSERVWKESLLYKSGETPKWTVYAYDGAKRLRTVTHPDGKYSEVVYAMDANGKPYTASYDELRHEKVTWSDAFGRTTQVREKNGSSYYYTTYQYDTLNNLARTVDAASNVTTATYDSLGNKLTSSDPSMGSWSYTYNVMGRLQNQTDAKGQIINFTYDQLGRIKTKVVGGQTTTWYYDESGYGASAGQLTRVVYPDGSDSLKWNNRGEQTEATRCVQGTCKTVQYTYDSLGRQKTISYPDGEVVTYGYDSFGNLASVSGYVTAMTWSSQGLTQIQFANGTTANYTYNANRLWLTSANVKKDTSTLYQASYTYDDAARVTSMIQGTPTAATLNFTYDSLNRLTGVSGAQTQTLAYNAIGNITSNSLVGTYTYGDNAHKHAVTTAGSKTYTYDANGNMTAGDGRTLAWSNENRLTSVTQGGQTTTFAYDANGMRVLKTASGVTTRYFGALAEQVGSSLVQYYYAGPILVAKKEAGGSKYWYHADRLGSIRLITNASGAEVRDYNYRPFGQIESTSGSLANERGFTGHRHDSSTGLIYMGARYYDPVLSRFVSADTIVPDPYNPQAFNRFTYAYNNPISNVDPTGHAPVVAVVAAVATAAAAVATATTAIAVIAVIGAVVTVAGVATKSPVLATIGSVMLGFVGGYAMPIGGSAIAGGVLGASVSFATSPVSPLDPGIKQAIGWAYTAYGMIRSFSSRSSETTSMGSTDPITCEGVEGECLLLEGGPGDNIRSRVVINGHRLSQPCRSDGC
jgi:RHS repeat-associated protein